MKIWQRDSFASVGDVQVHGLRLVFKVKLTRSFDANELDLRIYNLSASTRAKVSGVENPPVVLAAGHKGSVPVIFSGNARTVDHVRDGAEWVTHIQAGDGDQVNLQVAGLSFGPGTKVVDVAVALAKKLGIAAEDAVKKIREGNWKGARDTFVNGFTSSGRPAKDFNDVAKMLGMEWFAQAGALQVVEEGQSVSGEVVELSAESGLIGSPEHSKPEKGKPSLLKGKCLLNGTILPAHTISLRSATRSGYYTVESIEHSGDSHGQEWFTTVEARPL